MLPKTVFEQLTRASGIRSDRGGDERRSGVRVPLRTIATTYRMDAGRVGDPMSVRIKDVSNTGVAMLTSGKSVQMGGEFLLRLQPPGGMAVWLWCALRRRTEYDRTCTVTTAVFMKLLLPGQGLSPGQEFAKSAWVDVEGETTPDETAFRRCA